MVEKLVTFFKKLVLKERSPHKLALSFCMGVYIAFSPYLFLHTAMVFLFSWLFRLNGPVTFAAAYGVNNPWTMVPVYASDYCVGNWLMKFFWGSDMLNMNPSWMSYINEPLSRYVGIHGVSVWAFLIGGNLLGIVAGVILYPVMRRIFAKLVNEVHGLVHLN